MNLDALADELEGVIAEREDAKDDIAAKTLHRVAVALREEHDARRRRQRNKERDQRLVDRIAVFLTNSEPFEQQHPPQPSEADHDTLLEIVTTLVALRWPNADGALPYHVVLYPKASGRLESIAYPTRRSKAASAAEIEKDAVSLARAANRASGIASMLQNEIQDAVLDLAKLAIRGEGDRQTLVDQEAAYINGVLDGEYDDEAFRALLARGKEASSKFGFHAEPLAEAVERINDVVRARRAAKKVAADQGEAAS